MYRYDNISFQTGYRLLYQMPYVTLLVRHSFKRPIGRGYRV